MALSAGNNIGLLESIMHPVKVYTGFNTKTGKLETNEFCDGKIDKTEMKAATITARQNGYDKNKDGKINQKELDNFIEDLFFEAPMGGGYRNIGLMTKLGDNYNILSGGDMKDYTPVPQEGTYEHEQYQSGQMFLEIKRIMLSMGIF